MSIIIDIDHEGGDLSEYSSTATDAGSLSVAAGAALASSNYGLSCVIDDNNLIYGQATLGTANTSGTMRLRFYIDPNTISMGNNDVFSVLIAFNSSNFGVVNVQLLYGNSSYKISPFVVDDAGSSVSLGTHVITDEPHYIELKLTRATSDSANNGTAEVWIDGTSKQSSTTLDNYNRFVNLSYVRIGAVQGIDTTTRGTIYLDELIVNDDGNLIGPATGAITIPLDTLAGLIVPQTITASSPPPARTITLSALTNTGTPVSLTVVPGAKSTALDLLTATSGLIDLTVVPGEVTVQLAALTGSGTQTSITVVPGGVTVALNTLACNSMPVDVGVAPGAVAVALNALTLSGGLPDLSVRIIAPAQEVTLSTITSVSTPKKSTVGPGAVNPSLSSLVGSSSLKSISVSPGAIVVSLDSIALTSTLQDATVNIIFDRLVELSTLILGASPKDTKVQPGAVTVGLNCLTPATTLQDAAVIPGEVRQELDALTAQSQVQALQIGVGATSVSLNALILTATVLRIGVWLGRRDTGAILGRLRRQV